MDWIPHKTEMTSTLKDYFSKQSAAYAKYRPHYPESLFSYLASLTQYHNCALDCAAGNGQAALGLVDHFDTVIATDISEAQIKVAFPHPKIQYKVGRAEESLLPTQSVDLVTVAQGLHWFNLDVFYKEVKRVLKPQGTVAVWSYNVVEIEPAVDALVNKYHDEIVGPYWPPERHLVIDGYRALPFPFREIQPPSITMETYWTLENLLGYLRSWSATQRHIDSHGENPLLLIADGLRAAWKHPQEKKFVRWPLSLRVGFVG